MPKLDLRHAIRIKGAGGEIVALKGQGFEWFKPSPLVDAIILALFASGEQGGYYDPYDLTDEKLDWVAANPSFTSAQFMAQFPQHTLFQDSAGTIPVTGNMQPVGRVLDKSGRNNHLTQSISSARPLWQLNNGLKSFWFDGIDDYFTSTLVAGNYTNMTYWVNYRAASQTGYVFHDGGNESFRGLMSHAFLANINGNNSLVFSGENKDLPSQPNISLLAEMQGSKSTLTGHFRAPTTKVDYSIANIRNSTTNLIIGCRTNSAPAVFYQGHLYSLIIRNSLTPEVEAEPIRQLLATRSGVTL